MYIYEVKKSRMISGKHFYFCLKENVHDILCLHFFSRQLRFTAYRQYTAWTHYYEKIGRGCRVVISSCVVRKIREEFPEANGIYTCFKSALII